MTAPYTPRSPWAYPTLDQPAGPDPFGDWWTRPNDPEVMKETVKRVGDPDMRYDPETRALQRFGTKPDGYLGYYPLKPEEERAAKEQAFGRPPAAARAGPQSLDYSSPLGSADDDRQPPIRLAALTAPSGGSAPGRAILAATAPRPGFPTPDGDFAAKSGLAAPAGRPPARPQMQQFSAAFPGGAAWSPSTLPGGALMDAVRHPGPVQSAFQDPRDYLLRNPKVLEETVRRIGDQRLSYDRATNTIQRFGHPIEPIEEEWYRERAFGAKSSPIAGTTSHEEQDWQLEQGFSGEQNPAATNIDLPRLARIIHIGEGNYESYNTGNSSNPGGPPDHSFLIQPPGTVTGKTINQILATENYPSTRRDRMFAVGAYQITIKALREAKDKLKLTGNELLTPELQDRIFAEYLIGKAGGGRFAAFVNKGVGTIEDAQYAASKEWASIAVPAGYRVSPKHGGYISDGTTSYYAGRANSASLEATQKLREFLTELSRQRKR